MKSLSGWVVAIKEAHTTVAIAVTDGRVWCPALKPPIETLEMKKGVDDLAEWVVRRMPDDGIRFSVRRRWS